MIFCYRRPILKVYWVKYAFMRCFLFSFFSHTRSDNGDWEKMTVQISVFSPNPGNTAKNKFRIRWYFMQCLDIIMAWKEYVLEAFLVRILPHLDWIRRDTPNLSIFFTNTRKYGHFLRSEFCWGRINVSWFLFPFCHYFADIRLSLILEFVLNYYHFRLILLRRIVNCHLYPQKWH